MAQTSLSTGLLSHLLHAVVRGDKVIIILCGFCVLCGQYFYILIFAPFAPLREKY
jgi:hypothetical protein